MADPSADLSRGPVLLSFSLATASFALATTFVRFYVRRGLNGGFGADDYTSGAATVIALLGTIFSILEGSPSDSTRALQFNVIGQPWYLVSSTLSKVSICLFFMSLLRRARQWRILLAGLIVVMGIINLAFALAVYLQCRPLEKVWNPSAAGSCLDPSIQINFGYAQGAFSVFSWVFLALFPMLIIRDISRGGEPTWPFYATAALSFVCGIFVIVRTAQTSQTTGISIYTIHFFYASLMANLEQNLSLTTTNLLTLGPLFSPITTNSNTTTTTSTSSTTRSSKPRGGTRRRRDPYSSSSSSSGTRRSGKPRPKNNSVSVGIPSRAGSTRSITRPDSTASRTSSRASSRGPAPPTTTTRPGGAAAGGGGVGYGHGDREGEIDRKRTTHLIIEGPGTDRDLEGGGHDLGDGRYYRNRGGNGYGYGTDDDDDDGEEEDGYGGYGSDEGSEIDLEAWPRGIIKTVSVEVVEEVNEEWVAARRAEAAAVRAREEAERAGIVRAGGGGGSNVAGGGAAAGGGKRVGRNSVVIAPGGVVGVRQPRAVGGDNAERVSGGSVIEQDWEAMLRAGPPR